MEAINILNQAIEFNEKTVEPTIMELAELQLALVGGGTGDVVLP